MSPNHGAYLYLKSIHYLSKIPIQLDALYFTWWPNQVFMDAVHIPRMKTVIIIYYI